jgi:CHAT domain-containing protein
LVRRPFLIGAFTAIVLALLGSVGLYLLARNSFSQKEIHDLIQPAYERQRPGGGRLSGAAYAPVVGQPPGSTNLGAAQVLLLGRPASRSREDLQSLIYLADGDWQRFVDSSSHRASQSDASLLNNLGASFLALADKDPTLFLQALDAFEKALKLNPKAPEPLFNLVIIYRRLHFPKRADETLSRYARLDNQSPWYHELSNPPKTDEVETAFLDRLSHAAETNNSVEAEHLFETNPELCRRVVMSYALSGSSEQESTPLLHFVAEQMERRYHDKTLSAMVAPLLTSQREAALASREFVKQGAELYTHYKVKESLAAYAEADKIASKTDSDFDRFWIDLNRVDTQIRKGQFDVARGVLNRLIASARQQGYVWLEARAMSVYGSTVKLTASYTEMIDMLSKADRTFVDIDAPHDRMRVLYYLSAYRYGARDQEEALRLALEGLRLAGDRDALQINAFDWLIGSILYRYGLQDRAVLFANETVEQGLDLQNAANENLFATSLARIYESMSEYDLAEKYLKIAEDTFEQVPEAARAKSELLLGLVKARIKLHQKKYAESDSLLQKNLQIYSRQPFPATELLAQTLMLSAQVYSETGRIPEAARQFNEAIAVVENDDQYLQSEGLRVKFDDERRELYDAAIEFEFNNGGLDAAWTYLQKYRAKLFLEFLAAFNPNIEQVRTNIQRSATQHRVPKETQIVEYTLLKDRLLIWLMTDTLFTVRDVPIKRADLEKRVETVLSNLRTEVDADSLLTELGKVLIEPVSNFLDPNRTIVVIPDRALHGLPFGALKRPGKNKYLIEEFPIIESPSLTYFLAGNERTAETPRDAIVAFGSQNGGAPELKELNELSKIYGSAKLYAGQKVNKPSFLGAMNKAAIFHYAGHSATDAVDPLRSSILLDGNRSGPNSVTAVDISQQRLASNAVVILSSCDSSVGNSRDGIGVRGLTSAFLIGGAGAVVGSLWRVEASSTADLMIHFHHAFAKDHKTVAQALREAQLDFLQSRSERTHPYYWSGFVVTGNFSALR